MKHLCLILLLLLLGPVSGDAYHIAGGELTTTWVSGNTYQVRLTLYRDCTNPNAAYFDPTIIIGAYARNGNVLLDTFHVDLSTVIPLSLSGPNCATPPSGCMEQGDYIRNISLPAQSGGVYLVWERCCRNSAVLNINQAALTPMVFLHDMADPALQNSSPQFTSAPLPYTCVNSLFRFPFTATDPDGDSLVYALTAPIAGGYTSQNTPNPFSPPVSPGGQNLPPEPAPYALITWAPPFSISNVCGGSIPMSINQASGLVEAFPTAPGLYAMAVDVYEYRNGVYLGMVRREIEFTVIPCNNNTIPNLNSVVQNANYDIYASDTLSFPVVAIDPDGDSLYLSYSGDVFQNSPAPGLGPPYALTNDTSGLASIQVPFYWRTVCGQERDSLYRVFYQVRDNGCPLPLTSLGEITIRVRAVPDIPTPNLLCITISSTGITLTKSVENSILPRYFTGYTVYRNTNGGAYSVVGLISSPSQNTYTDNTAITGAEHCYYLVGSNSCGKQSAPSDTLCSSDAFDIPLVDLQVATVLDDRRTLIRWSPFPDGPFGTYLVERKTDKTSSTWSTASKLSTYSPNEWSDSDVRCESESYCYRIRFEDACGNSAGYSREACTILLQGAAGPFNNTLTWSAYRDWPQGIADYLLIRRIAEGPPVFDPLISNGPAVLRYEDNDLPPSGGAHRYAVIARDLGGNLESRSNEVELVQEPLLFVPSAFSPNGDALNSGWGPSGIFVREINWTIIDRWGQTVFNSRELNDRWDGRFEGQDCPQDVYAYTITYTGHHKPEKQIRSGTIMLLR